MAHAGQEIVGGEGFRLRLIQTAAETDGELLEMEASYGGAAPMPPLHLHPSQTERFEVLEGAVLTVIDGAEGHHEAGEVFEIPAGRPHQMRADGPARVLWQVRPALRTAEFFEALLSGAAAQREGGFPAFLEEFSDEFRLAG